MSCVMRHQDFNCFAIASPSSPECDSREGGQQTINFQEPPETMDQTKQAVIMATPLIDHDQEQGINGAKGIDQAWPWEAYA